MGWIAALVTIPAIVMLGVILWRLQGDKGWRGFLALVYASGGGTIAPDPDPIHDAQTTSSPHSGRNA
jgi:hypothetical protein